MLSVGLEEERVAVHFVDAEVGHFAGLCGERPVVRCDVVAVWFERVSITFDYSTTYNMRSILSVTISLVLQVELPHFSTRSSHFHLPDPHLQHTVPVRMLHDEAPHGR